MLASDRPLSTCASTRQRSSQHCLFGERGHTSACPVWAFISQTPESKIAWFGETRLSSAEGHLGARGGGGGGLEENPWGNRGGDYFTLEAKRDARIHVLKLPPYSPDLNPLDYSSWNEIETRMLRNSPKGKETIEAYKRSLCRTALRLPKSVVRKAVAEMPSRVQEIYDTRGGGVETRHQERLTGLPVRSAAPLHLPTQVAALPANRCAVMEKGVRAESGTRTAWPSAARVSHRHGTCMHAF